MKKITVIGIGKLGLCLSLNLEKAGYKIIAIDNNENYIKELKNKKFKSSEPNVNQFLETSKNIEFTTELKYGIDSDIIFIVVATPSTEDWKYNHSNIDNVLDKLISFGKQNKRKEIIINCTTFPGYCEVVANKLKNYNYYVSYSPEFITQGTIINDQLYSTNVLIGQFDDTAGNIIEDVYKKFMKVLPIFNKMSLTEAEITKISINCFLTTKISYANMIGDIAIRYGCNEDTILKAIGSDDRIGSKYLKYGYGYGGPCFPRDNRALLKCAEEVKINACISKSTDDMNSLHLKYQIENFIKNNPNKEIPIIFEYVTYKKESILIEESQQLKFALELKKMGYNIIVNDKRPEVIKQLENIL
jgi:nucleotide sugar dehydrogenase